MRSHGVVAECNELGLIRDVGQVRGNAGPLRDTVGLGQRNGPLHVFHGDIAHGHTATLGDQLTGKLAPHACAAAGNNSEFSRKVFHGVMSP